MKNIPKKMTAARMHNVGEPMIIESIETPKLTPNDVLIKVHSCGIVPNLGNILANWTTWFPERPLPPLPAVFGLDPVGEIVAVGSHVHAWSIGDRVYVNPGRFCGGCRPCRNGDNLNCKYYTFNGYFGFSDNSLNIYKNYPDGGLCEYMAAPQYSLVSLPENLEFEQATRLGYLGTAYAALRKASVSPGKTVLINGISGTLGLGAALLALGFGATKILGTARNVELLEKVKALAPNRIEILSLDDDETIETWVGKKTNGVGVDVFIDCLGPGAPHKVFNGGLRSLKAGGNAVNIGAIAGEVPIDLHTIMDLQQSITGSCWFSAGEGQDMVDMISAGTLDVSIFEQISYPLSQINEAISGIENRNGGFSNYSIKI